MQLFEVAAMSATAMCVCSLLVCFRVYIISIVYSLLVSFRVYTISVVTAQKTPFFFGRYCVQLRLYVVSFLSEMAQFFTRNIQDTEIKISGIICRPPEQIKFAFKTYMVADNCLAWCLCLWLMCLVFVIAMPVFLLGVQ